MAIDSLSPLFHAPYPVPALLAAISHRWQGASHRPSPQGGVHPPQPTTCQTLVMLLPSMTDHLCTAIVLPRGERSWPHNTLYPYWRATTKKAWLLPRTLWGPSLGAQEVSPSPRGCQELGTCCSTNKSSLKTYLISEISLWCSKEGRCLASTQVVSGYWDWLAQCQHFLAAGCTSLAPLGNSIPTFENRLQSWKYDLENRHKLC